jgi:hypothetical protein
MGGCRSLSNSGTEIDGLHDLLTDNEQDMFELALDREQRRDKHGYVAPAQARAFLQMARQLQLCHGAMPPRNPVAAAYFRATEWTAVTDADANRELSSLPAKSGLPPAPADCADAIAAVVDVLLEAGHWRAGAPWRARDALDAIVILDQPAWATLVGLTDECLVIHAGIGASRGSRTRAVSASAFEFISENSQIASVREFFRSLPETLCG